MLAMRNSPAFLMTNHIQFKLLAFVAKIWSRLFVTSKLPRSPITFSHNGVPRNSIVVSSCAELSSPAELLGRGVSYCATCDGAFFKKQEVAVVGSNDEALEEAEFLTRYASRVHLVSPRSKFQAPAGIVENLLKQEIVTLHKRTALKIVIGDEEVRAIRLGPHMGEEFELPVKGVFVYPQGAQPGTSFLSGELERGERGCILVDRATMGR